MGLFNNRHRDVLSARVLTGTQVSESRFNTQRGAGFPVFCKKGVNGMVKFTGSLKRLVVQVDGILPDILQEVTVSP